MQETTGARRRAIRLIWKSSDAGERCAGGGASTRQTAADEQGDRAGSDRIEPRAVMRCGVCGLTGALPGADLLQRAPGCVRSALGCDGLPLLLRGCAASRC